MMAPKDHRPEHLDVTAAMNGAPVSRISLQTISDAIFEEAMP
jgi:hypothetical protein